MNAIPNPRTGHCWLSDFYVFLIGRPAGGGEMTSQRELQSIESTGDGRWGKVSKVALKMKDTKPPRMFKNKANISFWFS